MKKITILQLIIITLLSFFVNVTEAQSQPQIKYKQVHQNNTNRLEFWVTDLPKVDFNCSDYFNDNNYSFFWYFGDGAYSQQDYPKHEFHDTGTFNVRVEATPIYSTDEPEIIILDTDVVINSIQTRNHPRKKLTPRRKPRMRNTRQLVPSTEVSFVLSHNFEIGSDFIINPYTSRPAPNNLPGNDFIKLQAPDTITITGTDDIKIIFQYPLDTFDFNYAISPNPTVNTANNYVTVTWPANLNKDSTKNIIVGLDVGDTTLVKHEASFPFIYRAILNDDFANPIYEDTLYLKVGKSLDPNKKEVNRTHIPRGIQPLKYRVHFQNFGEEPAYKIRIEDVIDPWLNINSLNLTQVVVGYDDITPSNFYQVARDYHNRVAEFSINYRLPGTNAPGYSPCNIGSTTGYVEYEIQTIDFSQPYNGQLIADGSIFGTYADIYFDDNGAVRTNDTYTQLDVNNSFCPLDTTISNENWNDTLVLTSVQQDITTENLAVDPTSSTVFDAGESILLQDGTLIQGNSWLVIDGCGAGGNPKFKQGGNSTQNDDFQENISTTNIGKRPFRVYPNPFKNSATIEYELTQKSPVHLQIFNINGQLRETLQDGEWMETGKHKIYFDASHLPNGVYLCKLQTKNEQMSLKLQIFK